MIFRYFPETVKVTICSFFIFGCQGPNISVVETNPLSVFKTEKVRSFLGSDNKVTGAKNRVKPLTEILDKSLADRNDGEDFWSVFTSAMNKDPVVVSRRQALKAKLAAIASSEAKKDYMVTSTVYGGIEDITDNTKGIALGLNASRLIFDGGMLDAQIASKGFEAEAAELNLQATLNERAYRLGEIWLEVEKYTNLQKQIDDRLSVLSPLLGQLEQIAKAGIGDVSRVTAAQRTVSGIRVTQTNISENLAKAQLDFLNAFGSVDKNISYDPEFIRRLLPNKINEGLAEKSPLLLAKYAEYQRALSDLAAVSAQDEFNVGFEARAMRPFAGSGYDSDESIGLVARKTIFNGGMLESDINEAEALAEATVAEIEATYRIGVRTVSSALQSIESMDKAIALARENAKVTSDEIVYLRQQLVIGGSTLDNVLSAEARLYEAEAKEITYRAERHKAELTIAGSLGLLGSALIAQQSN